MRDVVGYEGLYAVTSCGKVWSYRSQKFLKPYEDGGKYLKVHLSKNGVGKQFKVHRLVAQAYIPNPEDKPMVNHRDENKQNNCVNNLEWVTASENTKYGTNIARAKLNGLGRHPKQVYCVELNRTFGTIAAAANFINTTHSNVSKCLRGLQKTAGGYHWQYSEN